MHLIILIEHLIDSKNKWSWSKKDLSSNFLSIKWCSKSLAWMMLFNVIYLTGDILEYVLFKICPTCFYGSHCVLCRTGIHGHNGDYLIFWMKHYITWAPTKFKKGKDIRTDGLVVRSLQPFFKFLISF